MTNEEKMTEEALCKEETCCGEKCSDEETCCGEKCSDEETPETAEEKSEKCSETDEEKMADEEKTDADTDEEAEAKDDSEEEQEESERYMRLMAEFQNYKKRTEKERQDIYNYANEDIMKELIKVLDNFERAVETETEDEKYKEGMDLIFKQLSDVLEGAGLSEIEAEEAEFDPNYHNAVMMDNNEDFESGQVTEVLQKGYSLNGRVIRPSMVKVNN